MNKVLDGNIPATQTMLRIILKNDKIRVKKVGIQQWLQNLERRRKGYDGYYRIVC